MSEQMMSRKQSVLATIVVIAVTAFLVLAAIVLQPPKYQMAVVALGMMAFPRVLLNPANIPVVCGLFAIAIAVAFKP